MASPPSHGSTAARDLVGRDRELASLAEGVRALASGRGSVFLLSGEPGIGKTRLADEVTALAREAGAFVAWGAAWDGGGAPSYWPWIQVVRALRPRLPPPDERLRSELGPLWDDGMIAPQEPAVDVEVMRFRRFDALRAVLQIASGAGPLVVVLDDLHAADRASLLALQFVARALRGLPILVLGTHRDAEARLDPVIGETMERIARDATVLPLGRLARRDVAALMAGLDPVPAGLVDSIYLASGGNPLFVGETIRLVRMGGRPGHAPAVTAVIRDRLALFDPEARALLETAAVLGREVDWSVLAEVAATPVAAARGTLRRPVQAGVVEEIAPDAIRFSHALFRERLYDDLAPDARARLHLRAGEVLAVRAARRGVVPEETIARHLLRALPAGDPAHAADWAVRAGRTALRSLAFERAAELLEGSLGALDHLPPDAARRIDVELSLAEALARSGAAARGRAMCVAAAGQARAAGDGVRLARAALAHGEQLRPGIVDPELITLLTEALEMLSPAEEALRARVMARLAAAQQPAEDPQRPVQLARNAIVLARRARDAEALMTTLHTAGSALADYAPPEERLELTRELVSLALPRGELVIAQRAYLRAFVDCVELLDLAGADVAASAYDSLGKALGQPRWRWRGALARSMRALMDGRWTDAEAAQAEAIGLAEQADDETAPVTLAMHRLLAYRARDHFDPRDISTPWDVALDSLHYGNLVMPLLRASVLMRSGELSVARRALAALPHDDPRILQDPGTLALVADVALATGDRRWAAAITQALAPRAGRALTWGIFGLVWEGPVSQFLAAASSTLERWDDAVRWYEDALVEANAQAPCRARLSHELAATLLRRGTAGDAARATKLLDAASADAEALGMTHLSTRVERTRDSSPRERGGAAVEEAAVPRFTLTREGDIWTVSSGGMVARIKHSRAVEILDRLVSSPGTELHVLDLASPERGEPIDIGDAGEALDANAKAAYRRRIADLEDELRQAESWADAGRCDRLRAELEFLHQELARGVGLGDRDRRAGAAVERARVNVQKRLRGVVRKIAETMPALGRHLETELKTGTWVSYRRAR